MRRVFGVAAGLTLLVVMACGGGGSHSSGVASLSGSGSGSGAGGGTTSTTVGKQNVSELYAKWAQCMRDHGINIADPVVDDQGQISIDLPQGVSFDTYRNADAACRALHTAAQNAARGTSAPEKPDPAKLLNFSKCMRAHGLRDFPDPSPGGTGLQIKGSAGSDLNPNNPTFQAAQKACQSIMGPRKGGEMVRGSGPPRDGGGGGSGSGGAVSGG